MRWEFKVRQAGMVVASGDATTEADAWREGMHYAATYGQDGPVELKIRFIEPKRSPQKRAKSLK